MYSGEILLKNTVKFWKMWGKSGEILEISTGGKNTVKFWNIFHWGENTR